MNIVIYYFEQRVLFFVFCYDFYEDIVHRKIVTEGLLDEINKMKWKGNSRF